MRKYEPTRIGDEKLRVIDSRHAFIINNILSEVIKTGTGKKARSLGIGRTWLAKLVPRMMHSTPGLQVINLL